ncbi:MAG TPA: hypothetical protein VHM67_04810 [Gemmatimonadaceae bacterium]|nr:hypothetical protein [Gemmatimonadaceae bacterium]
MKFAMHRDLLFAALLAVACRDAAAPRVDEGLDVDVPHIPSTPAPVALVDADTTTSTPPPDMPEELNRPVTIWNYWTRASVSDRYASAEAFMEFLANFARQTVTLTVAADGQQIATVPPSVTAASYFLPIRGSLRTYTGIQVASECGVTDTGVTVHEAKNEWSVPGKSPFLLSHEIVTSQGLGGQPMCPEQPPKSPTVDDGNDGNDGGTEGGGGGGGGTGRDDGSGDGDYYLSCWYVLTYVDNVLIELDQISCTVIS